MLTARVRPRRSRVRSSRSPIDSGPGAGRAPLIRHRAGRDTCKFIGIDKKGSRKNRPPSTGPWPAWPEANAHPCRTDRSGDGARRGDSRALTPRPARPPAPPRGCSPSRTPPPERNDLRDRSPGTGSAPCRAGPVSPRSRPCRRAGGPSRTAAARAFRPRPSAHTPIEIHLTLNVATPLHELRWPLRLHCPLEGPTDPPHRVGEIPCQPHRHRRRTRLESQLLQPVFSPHRSPDEQLQFGTGAVVDFPRPAGKTPCIRPQRSPRTQFQLDHAAPAMQQRYLADPHPSRRLPEPDPRHAAGDQQQAADGSDQLPVRIEAKPRSLQPVAGSNRQRGADQAGRENAPAKRFPGCDTSIELRKLFLQSAAPVQAIPLRPLIPARSHMSVNRLRRRSAPDGIGMTSWLRSTGPFARAPSFGDSRKHGSASRSMRARRRCPSGTRNTRRSN